jgi:hypothetical protein
LPDPDRWQGAAPDDADEADQPCGEQAIAGLNEALWAKASAAKLLRTARVRADTTVISANVAYPTDVELLAKAVVSWCAWRGGCRRRAGPPALL